ncbi:hypothetical protein CPS_4499 [Colwellia psychrerythraea 34H]|uniref:Uncharacterized protein n=1 Tax=Colwellia psychrerythraea (strain 34H / ATCC BAA-681) TaxID=167879 RepID=Q47VM5_COLP3|nr:hypothetical protein CPS_4499 [Colwellia psychrerythraea 34H]
MNNEKCLYQQIVFAVIVIFDKCLYLYRAKNNEINIVYRRVI